MVCNSNSSRREEKLVELIKKMIPKEQYKECFCMNRVSFLCLYCDRRSGKVILRGFLKVCRMRSILYRGRL